MEGEKRELLPFLGWGRPSPISYQYPIHLKKMFQVVSRGMTSPSDRACLLNGSDSID